MPIHYCPSTKAIQLKDPISMNELQNSWLTLNKETSEISCANCSDTLPSDTTYLSLPAIKVSGVLHPAVPVKLKSALTKVHVQSTHLHILKKEVDFFYNYHHTLTLKQIIYTYCSERSEDCETEKLSTIRYLSQLHVTTQTQLAIHLLFEKSTQNSQKTLSLSTLINKEAYAKLQCIESYLANALSESLLSIAPLPLNPNDDLALDSAFSNTLTSTAYDDITPNYTSESASVHISEKKWPYIASEKLVISKKDTADSTISLSRCKISSYAIHTSSKITAHSLHSYIIELYENARKGCKKSTHREHTPYLIYKPSKIEGAINKQPDGYQIGLLHYDIDKWEQPLQLLSTQPDKLTKRIELLQVFHEDISQLLEDNSFEMEKDWLLNAEAINTSRASVNLESIQTKMLAIIGVHDFVRILLGLFPNIIENNSYRYSKSGPEALRKLADTFRQQPTATTIVTKSFQMLGNENMTTKRIYHEAIALQKIVLRCAKLRGSLDDKRRQLLEDFILTEANALKQKAYQTKSLFPYSTSSSTSSNHRLSLKELKKLIHKIEINAPQEFRILELLNSSIIKLTLFINEEKLSCDGQSLIRLGITAVDINQWIKIEHTTTGDEAINPALTTLYTLIPLLANQDLTLESEEDLDNYLRQIPQTTKEYIYTTFQTFIHTKKCTEILYSFELIDSSANLDQAAEIFSKLLKSENLDQSAETFSKLQKSDEDILNREIQLNKISDTLASLQTISELLNKKLNLASSDRRISNDCLPTCSSRLPHSNQNSKSPTTEIERLPHVEDGQAWSDFDPFNMPLDWEIALNSPLKSLFDTSTYDQSDSLATENFDPNTILRLLNSSEDDKQPATTATTANPISAQPTSTFNQANAPVSAAPSLTANKSDSLATENFDPNTILRLLNSSEDDKQPATTATPINAQPTSTFNQANAPVSAAPSLTANKMDSVIVISDEEDNLPNKQVTQQKGKGNVPKKTAKAKSAVIQWPKNFGLLTPTQNNFTTVYPPNQTSAPKPAAHLQLQQYMAEGKRNSPPQNHTLGPTAQSQITKEVPASDALLEEILNRSSQTSHNSSFLSCKALFMNSRSHLNTETQQTSYSEHQTYNVQPRKRNVSPNSIATQAMQPFPKRQQTN